MAPMATTKEECLQQMHAGFAEFDAVLAKLPRDRLTVISPHRSARQP